MKAIAARALRRRKSSGSAHDVFSGGGEMGALMRTIDWSSTPVGPVETWPQSLRTALSILLKQRTAVFLFWGPEHVQFYNDAYRPILGTKKHPAAMGQRGCECWSEIWDIIHPLLEDVYRGTSTAVEDGLLVIDRNGYLEEGYYTYTYSPIVDESGDVGGAFCVVYDTTERVIGERRLRTLRDLASRSSTAKTAEDACRAAAETLSANPQDVPFAALYLYESGHSRARLVGTAGVEPGSAVSPPLLRFDGAESAIAAAARSGRIEVIENLAGILGPLPGGSWPVGAESAIVLPLMLPGQALPAGFLLSGISPRKRLDQSYRAFFELVNGQIATAVAEARAYEEERKRAESLAELDRAKTAFFSNISHEFRTPLTLMLGPVEDLLSRMSETSGAAREDLELVHRNGLRLLKLVNTLLEFARIEAGRVQAAFTPADLAGVTADVASVFRSAMEKAALRLTIDCPPLPEPVYIDREMWEKIVLNLLSNALKFTFEGEVRVMLRVREGCAELSVSDTGIGIPPEHLPHIFERFHRVEGARGRTLEGSGIGLALVQELAALHGGSVRAESRPAHGSVFTVRIPLGREHIPAARISAGPRDGKRVDTRLYVEEALRWLPEAAREPADILEFPPIGVSPAVHTGEDGRAPSAERARILIADDNADMRDYIRRLLHDQYEVVVAPDGAAALAALRQSPFDLVLADIMMPRLDGFALLRELRNDPALAEVPVVLLSARAGEEACIEGVQAGADDYLVKPFGARELVARVGSRIEVARLRREATANERRLRLAAEAERARWHGLLLQAPAVIAVLRGPEHIFDLANTAYLRAVGRTNPASLVGKPIREALPEVEGQGYFELLDGVYRTGEAYVGNEHRIQLDMSGDGRLEDRYFNFVYQPSRNLNGEIEGILVHAMDVTNQVLARRQVEESERQLRTMADAMPQLVWMAEPDGRIFWYNRGWYEFTGTQPEQMIGWGWQSVHDPAWLPAVLEQWRRSIGTGDPFQMEFPLRAAGGGYRWFLTRVNPVRDQEGRILRWYGTNTDVTDLRNAQEAARESEVRFRELADSMPQIVWTADADGRHDYFNRRWYEFNNASAQAADGPAWIEVLHPDDRELWRRRWSEAVRQAEPFQMECRLRDRRSEGYRCHLVRAVAVRHGALRAIHWYGTCTDIEDEKRAEKAIRQKQRLESTGLLAGGVAHDFNNLLTGVLGNASLLLEEIPPGDNRAELLQHIVNAAERAAHLTRQMLAYAGKGSFVVERLDLSRQVREIANLIHAAIPKKVALQLDLPAELPPIEADPGQLQQIVMNLVINAAEAIGEQRSGTVAVTLREESIGPSTALDFVPEAPAAGLYDVLEVRDDGSGMDAEVLAHIFDPFFTTKFTGRGLGLSAVIGIVQSYHGALTVHSEPGHGSTFRVYFPIASPVDSTAPAAGAKPLADTAGDGTVLVVDDEEIVRQTAQHALGRRGYTVLTAVNGREGVDLVRDRGREIRAVLLDLTMPVMDGLEALQHIHAIAPEVPVILSSGYDESEATQRFSDAGLAGFIQKPYTAAQLANMVEGLCRRHSLRD